MHNAGEYRAVIGFRGPATETGRKIGTGQRRVIGRHPATQHRLRQQQQQPEPAQPQEADNVVPGGRLRSGAQVQTVNQPERQKSGQ